MSSRRRSQRTWLVLAAALAFTLPAWSQEQPGDPCSPDNAIGRSGGTETGGKGYLLTCQSGVWNRIYESDANANLGVKQDSPKAPLHVGGELIVGASTGLDCDADRQGGLRWNNSHSTIEMCDGATWKWIAGSAVAAGPEGAIQFNSSSALTGNASFVYTSAGRVGIGTATPSTLFHIHNPVQGTGSYGVFKVSGAGGLNNVFVTSRGRLSIGSVSPGVTDYMINVRGIDWENGNAAVDLLALRNAGYSMRFSVEHSGNVYAYGNVGIGTNFPSAKLHVIGDVRANSYCNTTGANCFNPASGAAAAGPEGAIQFNNSSALVGDANFIYTSEGNVNIGGHVNFFSGSDVLRVGGHKFLFISGSSNVALGIGAVTNTSHSISIGQNASTSGPSSIAIGFGALTLNQGGGNNVAIGSGAKANAYGGVALGQGTAVNTGSIAIGGQGTNALTDNAIVIGRNSKVNYAGSVVIGYQAEATASNQLVLGGKYRPHGLQSAYFGPVTVAEPTDFIINATGGEGTDIAGASLSIAGGRGTGNARGGSIVFQTSDVGVSGTTLRDLSTKMIIIPEGQVGIGTANPASTGAQVLKLDVEGPVGATAYCDSDGNNCFNPASGLGASAAPGSDQQILFNDSGTFNSASGFVFSSASGNVGVGLENPATKVDMTGTLRLRLPSLPDNDEWVELSVKDGGGSPYLYLGRGIPGTLTIDSPARVSFTKGVTVNGILSAGGSSIIDTGGSTNLTIRGGSTSFPDRSIRFQNGNGSTNIMTLLGGGRTGIGTLTPLAMLQVNAASAAAIGQIIRGAASQTANLTEWQDSNGTILSAFSSAGALAIGKSTPTVALDVVGDIAYTGDITDVSDQRLKKDIHPLSDRGPMLDLLGKVKTYSFVMIDDKHNQTKFGVMAQELEEIFPELVKTAPDELRTKSVNYIGLIPPLIQAMQEQQIEVHSLQQTNQQLEQQIQSLDSRLRRLEQQAAE
ncbi:tail fiber domain-containing protein [Planctomicrobium sp. SH664]|uniref:tail fiber domain-containing protein n=1 Tax=Planctomicrobium sp. SH664 TaxID=3448125 RepID=UPI003F5BCF77